MHWIKVGIKLSISSQGHKNLGWLLWSPYNTGALETVKPFDANLANLHPPNRGNILPA